MMQLWVGMEFMAGGGLDGLIDREDLTEARIAELSRDILAGLAYLHRRNIVHRDMKSDNVLLTADGRAKLADFGVACQLTEKVGNMAPGRVRVCFCLVLWLEALLRFDRARAGIHSCRHR